MTKPTKQCDSRIPQKCGREVWQEERGCYVRNQTDYRVAGNVVLSDAEIYIDSQRASRVILIRIEVASAIPRYKKKNQPLGLDKSLAQLEKYFIDTFLHIRQLVACCSAYVIYIYRFHFASASVLVTRVVQHAHLVRPL